MLRFGIIKKGNKVKKISLLIISISFLLSACSDSKNVYRIEAFLDKSDVGIVTKRLKLIGINDTAIVQKGENQEFIIKESELQDKKIFTDNFFEILFSNHTYELYFVDKSFEEEIKKYIDSDNTYDINFKAVITKPVLTGIDVDWVKTLDETNPEEIRTKIKYTGSGALKNQKAKEQNKDKIIIDLLDKEFWSFGNIYLQTDSDLTSNPDKFIFDRFKKIGKDYNHIDIKNITLFSRFNYINSVKIVKIEKIEK